MEKGRPADFSFLYSPIILEMATLPAYAKRSGPKGRRSLSKLISRKSGTSGRPLPEKKTRTTIARIASVPKTSAAPWNESFAKMKTEPKNQKAVRATRGGKSVIRPKKETARMR